MEHFSRQYKRMFILVALIKKSLKYGRRKVLSNGLASQLLYSTSAASTHNLGGGNWKFGSCRD
jgi:hypothetical protein